MDYTKESVQTIKCYPTNRQEKSALDILKSFKNSEEKHYKNILLLIKTIKHFS